MDKNNNQENDKNDEGASPPREAAEEEIIDPDILALIHQFVRGAMPREEEDGEQDVGYETREIAKGVFHMERQVVVIVNNNTGNSNNSTNDIQDSSTNGETNGMNEVLAANYVAPNSPLRQVILDTEGSVVGNTPEYVQSEDEAPVDETMEVDAYNNSGVDPVQLSQALAAVLEKKSSDEELKKQAAGSSLNADKDKKGKKNHSKTKKRRHFDMDSGEHSPKSPRYDDGC